VNPRDWIDDPRVRRWALPVGGAVVLVALLVTGILTWVRVTQSRAEAAFAEASVLVQPALAPDGTPEARARAISALEALLKQHPRAREAPQAAYVLGNLEYAAADYPAARGAYQIALAKGATGTLKTLSAVGIGYTWEAEKNYANAVTAYEAALRSSGPKDFLYEDMLMSLARAQELQGNATAAAETYQRLLRDVPDTRRTEDLKTRLAQLKERAKP